MALNVIRVVSAERARRRVWDAERRFFDAYGRGGACARDDLVIPLEFFARPAVARVLVDWLQGRARAPDMDVLETEWMQAVRGASPAVTRVTVFYRNLAHFVSLL